MPLTTLACQESFWPSLNFKKKGNDYLITCNLNIKKYIITNTNSCIKHYILMHVIIFFSVYLSFYEKVIMFSKCINLGLIMIN